MSIRRAVILTAAVAAAVVAVLLLSSHVPGRVSGPPDQLPNGSDAITFTIALDRDQRVGAAYNVPYTGVPLTLLIDEEGVIGGIRRGAFPSKEALISWLDDLITGEAPSRILTEAPAVGYLAPDFTLATLDGGVVTLSQLRDRWVLVNFWTTRCTWCMYQMPFLQAAFEERGDEIEFIGINLGESESRVRQHTRG